MGRTCLLILSLASLATALQAQDFDFEAKGQSLHAALKALSQKSGQEFACDASFDNLALILRSKHHSLAELTKQIASVTLGTWEATKTGHKLVPDKAARKAAAKSQLDARAVALKQAVDTLAAGSDGAAWTAQQAKQIVDQEVKQREEVLKNLRANSHDLENQAVFVQRSSTRDASAATGSLIRLLQSVPATELASIQPGVRVVYSINPTPMQKRLAGEAQRAVRQFIDNHNMLARASRSVPLQPKNVTFRGGVDLDATEIEPSSIRMILAISRRAGGDGLHAEVKFALRDGSIIGSASRYLAGQKEGATPEQVEPLNGKLELPELAREIAGALASGTGDGNNQNVMAFGTGGGSWQISSANPLNLPPLSKQAVEHIVNTEQFDPQAAFLADAVLGATDADVAVCAPDAAMLSVAREVAKGPTGSGVIRAMQKSTHIGLENGWLTGSALPAYSQSVPIDRTRMQALLVGINKVGYARLRDQASFALSLGLGPSDVETATAWIGLVDPNVAANLSSSITQEPDLFKLLGTLEASVFDSGKAEYKFPVLQMTQLQKRLVTASLFGADRQTGLIGEGDMMMVSMTDSPMEIPGPNLKSEPTESMPNGAPLDFTLTLSVEPEEFVFAKGSKSRGGRFLDAETLGGMQGFAANPGAAEMAALLPSYDSFWEAGGSLVNLSRPQREGEVVFGPNGFIDGWINQGAIAKTFEQLPDGFKDKALKAKAQAASAQFRFGQPDSPPPLYAAIRRPK